MANSVFDSFGHSYVYYNEADGTVTLDGEFTEDDLRELADAMRAAHNAKFEKGETK